jgi:hypothetical protein
MLSSERASHEREVASLERERASLERERASLEREHAKQAELDRLHSADLQYRLDCAAGLLSARSVMEKIARAFAPAKTVTTALEEYCDHAAFRAYLASVSSLLVIPQEDLHRCARAAYSTLSQTLHHGSTLPDADADRSLPRSIVADKCMLAAICAIFRFARRDARFYVNDFRDVPELPAPAHSRQASPSPSAPGTPPQVALSAAAGGGGV